MGTNAPILPNATTSLANDSRSVNNMPTGSTIIRDGTSAGVLRAEAILNLRGGGPSTGWWLSGEISRISFSKAPLHQSAVQYGL
jgi:hypothetical protein